MTSKPLGFSTRAIHSGHHPADAQGALNPPVYLNATYAFDSVAQGQRRFLGEEAGYIYSRVGNPTQSVLEQKLAGLEGGEAALATASGMGAITALVWTLVEAGDEILADKTIYGCTYAYLTEGLGRFGVKVRFVDMTRPKRVKQAIGPRTRLLFLESPTNPNMRIVDIRKVCRIAHRAGARVIVDNTYATPYLQRPIELGADFVVHSMTKYLGGHGDLIAGAVIGPAEELMQVRVIGIKDMTGAVVSPFDAYLTIRGIKTLAIRMQRHCRTARRLAQRIERHPAVARVHYPGLKSHPQHRLAKRQMRDFGGMIGFELKGGYDAGVRFMDSLRLALRAVSLGDAETLVQHPASMTHITYPPEERAKHDISEGLVRISVGLEDSKDLWHDIRQALDVAGRSE
ncbi:MAG TPA: methionine gamma-lyase [Sedimenticola thiotaurini]|uniref:L-methionine gamma-lyase n=1 Tax=Sedimenticola thiotaurini TaxID=1543721 RepID=A0A831RN57_9GAMM|nr:methionine gamma-lyase [Sedimenticola thiotaurini]